jgi:hypothetical protein
VTDAKQVIARQITYSGETLLLGMEPVDDSEFFAENKNGLSAAWVLGHLACVADLFSSWFDGRKLLSSTFHQVFNDIAVAAAGPVSKAAGVDPALYPKDDLLLSFNLATVKALRALREFGSGQWDAPGPPGIPVTLLTGGAVWERLARHTDWHCGELAGSMPRFFGTYTLNILPHHLYVPPDAS